MNNETQRQFIVDALKKDGFVSRNFALKNYISRLSDIIFRLKSEGWEFTTEFVEENNGKNFYYRVKSYPKVHDILIFN